MEIGKMTMGMRRTKMKLTSDNLEKIFNYIESQLEDDDGRGEFDEETQILSAVDRTIEMFKEKEDQGLHFADELHKINDMLMCSKEDFLYSYAYLSEDDYEKTRKYIIDVFKKHYKTNNILADVDTYEEKEDE